MTNHRVALLAFTLALMALAGPLMGGCRAAETQAGAQAPMGAQDDAQPQTVEDAYMGLSGGPMSQATIADLPEGVVLQSGDLSISREELEAFIDERVETPEQKAALGAEAFFVAEQLAVEPLLEREAQAWAQTQEQDPGEGVIDAHLQHIANQVTVTDEDVRAFYDANTAMFEGASYEQVAEQLRQMVLGDRQQEAIGEHIDGLGGRQAVTVDASFLAEVAPKALANVVDEARRSGKPSFVDFGSEGCQACDMMAPIIEELAEEFGDRANIVLVQVREQTYLAARYGIRSIPVQRVYDAQGQEVFDHLGFLGKDAILEELAAVGVE